MAQSLVCLKASVGACQSLEETEALVTVEYNSAAVSGSSSWGAFNVDTFKMPGFQLLYSYEKFCGADNKTGEMCVRRQGLLDGPIIRFQGRYVFNYLHGPSVPSPISTQIFIVAMVCRE